MPSFPGAHTDAPINQFNNVNAYLTNNGHTYTDDFFNTVFSAILPPNSPSCWHSNWGRWNYITASSYHAGGVNVAFCDASARFVTDSINVGNLNDLPGQKDNVDLPGFDADYPSRWGGPSTYGIWGALATAANGESASLYGNGNLGVRDRLDLGTTRPLACSLHPIHSKPEQSLGSKPVGARKELFYDYSIKEYHPPKGK